MIDFAPRCMATVTNVIAASISSVASRVERRVMDDAYS